jgi:hypothetical protein
MLRGWSGRGNIIVTGNHTVDPTTESKLSLIFLIIELPALRECVRWGRVRLTLVFAFHVFWWLVLE